MNLLRRAIAKELLLSSRSSSAKYLLLMLQEQHHQERHSISVLQNRSSPYSTSTTRLKNAAKKPNPQQQLPLSWSKTREETVQTQEQVPEELGLKKEESKADWPRPSEIPWQTKVANSVNLIGYVQIPVQFKVSSDGKYWAGTIIYQRNDDSFDSPPFWIPVIFEGDLAHIAVCHLKAKDHVYIAGQLSADPPPFTMSEGQANVQVMVRSINFVEGSSQVKKTFTPRHLELDKGGAGFEASLADKKQTSGVVNKMKNDGDRLLDSWRDLLRNPQKWWDHRGKKLSGLLKANYPDFKHKDSGLALWLNSAPTWVMSGLQGLEFDVQLPKVNHAKESKGLQGLEFDVQLPKVNHAKESKGDDSWKNLVEHPEKWWDNRGVKFNVKSPDFKHKDTGEGLWLSSSPSWVSSRLPPLKAKHTASIDKMHKPQSERM